MSIHEVKCINKTEHGNPHERIRTIGGYFANGATWKLDHADAIKEREEGKQRFYVSIGSRKIEVVVALSRQGDKYLKTEMDGEQPTRLLSLYECAEPVESPPLLPAA